jgi:hypothetical protein
MTAVLTPPSQTDTRSALADWLELQAIASPRGRVSKAALLGILDIVEDDAIEPDLVDDETGEVLDEAILEDERNAIVGAAFEELEYRARVLGAAYPFVVDGRRLVLDRVANNEPGQAIYLFCLLASVIRERKLQPLAEVNAAEQGIADAFQICACLAAGGYLSGAVSSFGFPRATGDGFIPALKAAFARFGMGEVRAEIPDGLPESLKDGGIDVIAWRNHPDGMPSKMYLLGQCASGQNWAGKSVVEYIQQLHGSWFTFEPARFSTPAMFIPFIFHRDIDEDRTGSFLDAVKNRFWYEEKRFGIIFDRLRIAHFAQVCLGVPDTELAAVDGRERIGEIQAWIAETLRVAGMAEAA